MRVLVVHDKRGNINSFGIPNKKLKGEIRLQPPSGKYVTEVEVAEIKGMAGGSEEEHARIHSILERSRLDLSGAKPKLVQK